MINLLTAVGLTPGTVHIYTQTIHITAQLTQTIHRTQLTNWEECWPCSVFASYTLAFALQMRKKHGKTSVRARGGDVGVATRYRLSGSEFEPRWGKKSFPLSYRYLGHGAHQVVNRYRGPLLEVKRQGCSVDHRYHLLPSMQSCTPALPVSPHGML